MSSTPTPLATKHKSKRRTLTEKSQLSQQHEIEDETTQEQQQQTSSTQDYFSSNQPTTQEQQQEQEQQQQGTNSEPTSIEEREILNDPRHQPIFLLRELEEEASVLVTLHDKLNDQLHRLQVEEMLMRKHIESYESRKRGTQGESEDTERPDLSDISRFLDTLTNNSPTENSHYGFLNDNDSSSNFNDFFEGDSSLFSESDASSPFPNL